MASLENKDQDSSPRKRIKLESSIDNNSTSTSPPKSLNTNTLLPPSTSSNSSAKITTSSSSSSNLGTNPDIKMEDAPFEQPNAPDLSEPSAEVKAGILYYVNKSNPGFKGTLKQRYTDFLVNEIDLDGNVLRLLDDRAPRIPFIPYENGTNTVVDENQPPTEAVQTEPPFESTKAAGLSPTDDPLASGNNVSGSTEPADASLAVDPLAPGNKPSGSTEPAGISLAADSLAPGSNLSASAESGGVLLAVVDAVVSDNTPATDPIEPSAEVNHETSEQTSIKVLRPNDLELLAEYFGEPLAADIVELDKKIQRSPNVKASGFPNLQSAQFDDKQLRGRVHNFVRRVFENRLETEATPDGSIAIYAASPKGRGANPTSNFRFNNPKASNQRSGNHRSDANPGQAKGKVGWQELGGEYLHFNLYKENKDTMEAIMTLSRLLRVKPKDFSSAGTKDRRAVTVQRISAFRHQAQRLANLNNKMYGIKVGDFKYEKSALRLGDLEGNEFHITLRDCTFGEDTGMSDDEKVALAHDVVGKAVTHIRTHGFINYFGLQRFGTFGIGTDDIGRMILKEDFKAAVDSLLTYTDEALKAAQHVGNYGGKIGKDDIARAKVIHEFKQTGKDKCLRELPRRFGAENAIIKHLSSKQSQTDFLGAILSISRNHRTIYVHAYQSLVWNAAASERWVRHGDKVIEGDLVLVKSKAAEPKDEYDENGEIVIHPSGNDFAFSSDEVFQRARRLSAEEAASGSFTIFDIVLPLPGYDIEYPGNDIGDFYKDFMGSERGGHLDPADMRRRQKDFSLSGSYRKVLGRVRDDISFRVMKYHEEHEQLVETDWEVIKNRRGESNHNRQSNAPLKDRDDRKNNVPLQDRNDRANDHGRRQNGRNQRTPHDPDSRQQGAQGHILYAGSAQLNAWKALPAKLAEEDKAAAEAWEIEKSKPIDVASIPQPIYKETFIETSAENEGRRTGVRYTQFLNAKNEVIDESTLKATIKKEVEVKVEPVDALVEDSGDDNEAQEGGVKLDTSVTLKRTAEEISEALPEMVKQEEVSTDAIQIKPEVDASSVDVEMTMANPSSIYPNLAEPVKEEVGVSLVKTEMAEVAEEALMEETRPTRLAIVIKLGLGTSMYATMALRELMQHGGVQVYKPDFSSGR